jgi:hypothetical protein
MYTGNGIFQTAIQLPIQDAIGKGIEIESGEMDNTDIDSVLDYWEDNRVWDTILNAWTWVRLFGGGAIMINTDQDPEKPLSLKNLKNKAIEFYDIDRWQMDVNAAYFDDWDSYIFASNGMINLYGEPIHSSRFLRGQGKRAPHYVRRQLRGWGMSEGERMIRDLNLYMKTQDVNFEILDEAKVDIYKIQGLAAKLMTAGGTSAITTRVQAANEIKNYVNALVLDSNEDYQQKQMGFAGLAEIMQQNRMGVAAALRIPMTKLFGMSASGFNTGESDLENYNAMIESEIRSPLRPWIRQMLKVTMAHLFGYVPEFKFTFPSLREQTPEVEQQVKDSEYNRAMGLYDRGLLSSQEAMQILRKSGVVDIETEVETGANPNPEPPNGPSGIEDSALPGKLAGEDEGSGYRVIRNIQNKGIEETMREFKKGTLKTPQGKTVTDKDQAIAIGLSEERKNSGHKIFRKKKIKNAEWDESKHPRAADGKFGSGGGSSSDKDEDKSGFTENKIKVVGGEIKVPNEAKNASEDEYYEESIKKNIDKRYSDGERLRNKYPGYSYDNALQQDAHSNDPIYPWDYELGPLSSSSFESGFYGYDKPKFTVGWRYGKSPESGKSKNFAEGIMERGVSFMQTSGEDKTSTSYELFQDVDKTDVEWYVGYEIPWRGSDGEPLMVNVKPLKDKFNNSSLLRIFRKKKIKNAEWDESKHPRAADGKFGSGGGSSSDSKKKDPKQEYDEIKKQYEGKSEWMKAPNGKESKLNERQWIQVRTPSFKNWFGDWENDFKNASKVVDKNGDPLVVYHGSGENFDTFSKDKIGSLDSGARGSGFYLTKNKEYADFYTAEARGEEKPGYVLNLYANIRNPYTYQDNKEILDQEIINELNKIYEDKQRERYEERKKESSSLTSILSFLEEESIPEIKKLDKDTNLDDIIFYNNFLNSKDFTTVLKKLGYDGVIYKDGQEIVVFEPNQIKSATDNSGEFDPDSESIKNNSPRRIYCKKNSEMSEELSRTGLYKKGDKLKYDPKELEMGIQVELEHADDKESAKQIALDHLMEDADYYSKLKKAGL